MYVNLVEHFVERSTDKPITENEPATALHTDAPRNDDTSTLVDIDNEDSCSNSVDSDTRTLCTKRQALDDQQGKYNNLNEETASVDGKR